MNEKKNKKNIYFAQAGVLYGVNAYFPYASGCVAAFAWSNPAIRDSYRLGRFLFLREPVDQAAASFEEPFLVAFSNYVWNFEYHKALARAVKKRFPNCLILFGGHHVLNDSAAQLEEYPFVDYLIHGAGERPFEQLLLALARDGDPRELPSLSFRGADGKPVRTPPEPCEDYELPSPYLTGIFDSLFAEYPDILFSMTLETNRGCPYGCAFCDWGTVRHALHRMPMERVKAEIDWGARHKVEYFYCADGNFGILERDDEIVDYLIESKRRTGYPKKINACFAKNSNETVFRLNQKLSEQGLNSGATLSFQSLSPAALENVGRKNLNFEQFHELLSLYNQANVPVYTELILGLPGETLESFAQGIGALLAAGMHGALDVFPCELLPNAKLSNPAFKEEHGIEGIRVRQMLRHGSPKNQDEVPEYSDIIRQTKTMPVEDWITAYLFSTLVQGFHSLGLLLYIAVFLHWERELAYERFYFDLMAYAKANPSTLMGELLLFHEERYRALSEGSGESLVYYHPRFGEVTWPLAEALFLCAALEAERFYRELPAFLRQYSMDDELLRELIRFQRAMVRLPEPPPEQQLFDYDFHGYFAAAAAGQRPVLHKKRITLRFPDQTPPVSWADYARENVWYGRRKGLLKRKEYQIEYEES
ncbi:MAG: radical SAM protein [Oscillospiraceae bacterium]|nr:radical SAM protein [Oscillospiraceae bacterium]